MMLGMKTGQILDLGIGILFRELRLLVPALS